MPAAGQGPRRTTSLEEIVISTSPLEHHEATELTRRQTQFSAEPLLSEPSPQHQQAGHWFRHRARPSRTGSEYDPDEHADTPVQQPAGSEHEGLSPGAIEKLSKLKVFQHLRDRQRPAPHQAQDGPTTGRQGPGPPQRRASNLQVAAHTVAGDLHTSEHTKKDTREHHLLKSFRRKKKKSSHGSRSDKGSQEGMSDIVRMEELEEAERKAAKPRWKRRQFWHTAIPLFVSAVLLVVGTVLALKHYQTQNFHGNFDAWRWLLMVGLLVPIHHTGNLAVRCMVWAVESIFFFQKKALYYLVGTKKYLSRMIKGALVTGIFAAIFKGQSDNNHTVHQIYEYIIRVLVCIFLWLVVDVLKTMGAKLMANHFHQETYFQRMQEALRKEYFLMALSKPRSENRASKHIRVASTTAGIMTGHAASVTAGMTPRHADALRKVNEREAAFDEANRNDSKPAPKGIMRNLKTGASGIAKVAPRMVKFRSNIQFLGEKVAEITPAPLKRMLSSRPSSRKPTTEDREHGSETEMHRNPLSSTSQEAPRQRPQDRGLGDDEGLRRARTAPAPMSDEEVQTPAPPVPRTHTMSSSHHSTQGRGVDVIAEDTAIHHRRTEDGFQETTDPQPPVSRRSTASTQGDLASRLQSPASSKRVSQSSSHRSLPPKGRSLRRSDSRTSEQPAGYSTSDRQDTGQPKMSGWAKLRMARRLQNNVKEVQAENVEKRKEEIHLAELTATARNDEEVIAKLHKVEKHIRKNNLTVTFTDQLGQAKHSEQVTGEKEARKLAFYLFWNIKPYFTRNHIIMEDLEAFLSPEQAVEAFAMLDNNGDGKLVLADIRDAVIKIYKERRNLALSLKDTKTVVGKLELVIGVALHIIFIFFYLMVFNVNVTKVWLTLSSIIVALSFAFSNTIMNLFNSVIMLFVVHPFDVGDALLIATNTTASGASEYVVVEELSLQSTVMRRWDGTRIWYPNVKLNAMPLLNMSRSDSKVEIFKVQVDVSTPSSVTATLRRNLMEFFDENSKEFVPGGGTVIYLDSQDPLKMTLGIVFTYAHNGVNLGRTGEARHKIFVFISTQLSDLGVTYSLPSFKGASGHGGPDGMAFARPNPILPGRSNFRRSQGFDTGHTGDAGGGVE